MFRKPQISRSTFCSFVNDNNLKTITTNSKYTTPILTTTATYYRPEQISFDLYNYMLSQDICTTSECKLIVEDNDPTKTKFIDDVEFMECDQWKIAPKRVVPYFQTIDPMQCSMLQQIDINKPIAGQLRNNNRRTCGLTDCQKYTNSDNKIVDFDINAAKKCKQWSAIEKNIKENIIKGDTTNIIEGLAINSLFALTI